MKYRSRAALGGVLVLSFSLTVLFPVGYSIIFAPVQPWADPVAPLVDGVDPNSAQTVLGNEAPDFSLRDLEGQVVRMGDFRGRVPVVIEFGSYTCPYCTGQTCQMDDLAKKYAGQVPFLFVYCEEAHPSMPELPPGYVGDPTGFSPGTTDAERRTSAREMRANLQIERPILVEPVDVSLRELFLPGPLFRYNPVFMVNTEGKIVYAARWLNAAALDAYVSAFLASGGTTAPASRDALP